MRGMRLLLCKRFIGEFTIQHFAINSSNPVGTCYSWLGCITENKSNWEAVLHIQHKQMKPNSLGVNKSLLFPPLENVLTKFSGIKWLFLEMGGRSIWSTSRQQTWTLALHPDDQWSPHAWVRGGEIWGSYYASWGGPKGRTKCDASLCYSCGAMVHH